MVERPEEATTVPAHHSMRWHHLCILCVPPWTYATASLHNAYGTDGGTASRGNGKASASFDALASPLRPLGAAMDVRHRLSAQRRQQQWWNSQSRQRQCQHIIRCVGITCAA